MKLDFCTFFDSNYIDRALVMIESLHDVCAEATVYIIAFDDKCFEILQSLDYDYIVAIPYSEFENSEIKELRRNRSARSFFWTCSGLGIRYVMSRFGLEMCTFIDSDLFFYSSPIAMINKFVSSGCDVAIISHNFSKHMEYAYYEKKLGKYCVQFNSFRNTKNGMEILDWWIGKCVEDCPETATESAFGDQKYLDNFKSLFNGVYEYEDFGAGIAPWNVDDYVSYGDEIQHKLSGEKGKLIFYHFHSLELIDSKMANIHVFVRPGKHDKKLVDNIYCEYLYKIIEKRFCLKEKYELYDNLRGTQSLKAKCYVLMKFIFDEPNIIFLLRKIWRYLIYKKYDFVQL